MPAVSVIVPVYNGEKYLRECLDSLLAQTLEDLEIIVVDDGSTDGSAEICHEYLNRDPRRVRYMHTANSGQSAARNIGLDNATGKYIAFCDADDTYAPYAMEMLLTRMNDCDVACAGFIWQNRAPSGWNYNNKFQKYDSTTAIKKSLYQKQAFNTSCSGKLFKAELFDGIRFVNGLYYEDLEIIPRIYARCNRIAITRDRLYFYRKNETSFINTWHPRRLDAIRATEKVFSFIGQHRPELLSAARSRRFSAYFNIFVEASRHGDKELASSCYSMIRRERIAILSDPETRWKNKAGALVSYLGRAILGIISTV